MDIFFAVLNAFGNVPPAASNVVIFTFGLSFVMDLMTIEESSMLGSTCFEHDANNIKPDTTTKKLFSLFIKFNFIYLQ